ncbi:hypothetical protein PHET_02177 [Paragonimus heterotremus]|uniref:Uncharacterized protein n=1 Tax=Paragonimus heterotremus TaxID=100268 RepID=A0A8J4SSH7_9TREM|nr:hypothetical protein PHET_02177 [Paragonimus heterotremus]
MECLQFPRLCRARYITYNRLAELSNTGQFHSLRMDKISSNQSQISGKKCQNGEKQLSFNPVSRSKLVLEVSFAVSSSGKKLPELRLRRLIKCASARGPVLSKPQGDYILENAVTTCQDKSVSFIRSGLKIAAVLQQLAIQLDCVIPTSLRPHSLTGVSLNKLVELLKFQRKSLKNKTTGDQEQLRLPNWLSYSCDGTLTICYPTGHIAVIWTPSPKKYTPPVNVQPTDCPDSDSIPKLTKQSTFEPLSHRRKAMPANTKRNFPVRQSPIDTDRPFWPQSKSKIEQTGFYLFLFDSPPECDPANMDPSCTLASTAFKDYDVTLVSAYLTSTSELDGPNNTGQKHLPESRLLKRRESVNKLSVETNIGNMINVEENFPVSSYLKHQQTSPTTLTQVGQMLAQFTPSGEGVIFSNSNVQQTVDEKPAHLPPNCNLHVVFTPTMNYMFQPTGHPASPSFPYALKSQTTDSTTKLPSTVDIQLNKYLTVHCTSSTDLAVIFRVDKYVELKIFCHQPQEKEQNTKHTYGRRLLSKLPFLNASVDTPSGRPIPLSRKRREEAFQRLFKGMPSLESDEYLRRHLQKASEEIALITENWLTFLRAKLRLHRLRSSSRSPIRKAVPELDSSADRGRARFKRIGQAAVFMTVLRAKTLFTREQIITQSAKQRSQSAKSPEHRTSSRQSHRKSKRFVETVDEPAVSPLGIPKTEVSLADLLPTTEVSFADLPTQQEFPESQHASEVDLKPFLVVPLSVSLPDLSTLMPNSFRLRGLPCDCPVLLRTWLHELCTREGSRIRSLLSRPCVQPPTHQTARSQWVNRERKLVDRLIHIEFRTLKVAAKGCRCDRYEPPGLTDLELDLFLDYVVPPEQAIVMVVYDSRNKDSSKTKLFKMAQQLYTEQHRCPLPTARGTRNRAKNSARSTSREVLVDSGLSVTQHGVGGTGACAAMATKLAHYRFFTYDLDQHSMVNEPISCSNALLRQRHGQRPGVGDCLIFIHGQLCYIGNSLSGYPDMISNKNHLEQKILECRTALLRHGSMLPMDFKLLQ